MDIDREIAVCRRDRRWGLEDRGGTFGTIEDFTASPRSDGDGVRNGVQRIEHNFTKRLSERVFYRERGELHTDCSELRGEVLLLRTHNGCDISVSEDFRPGVRDERV